MPINFRQLEVFRAVAETKSFTRASHLLFISQSTVSQHIRELEDSLNLKLFHRNRRSVSLSPAGESLLEKQRNESFGIRRFSCPEAMKWTPRRRANESRADSVFRRLMSVPSPAKTT